MFDFCTDLLLISLTSKEHMFQISISLINSIRANQNKINLCFKQHVIKIFGLLSVYLLRILDLILE